MKIISDGWHELYHHTKSISQVCTGHTVKIGIIKLNVNTSVHSPWGCGRVVSHDTRVRELASSQECATIAVPHPHLLHLSCLHNLIGQYQRCNL